jgi:phosphotriesterase-related protein
MPQIETVSGPVDDSDLGLFLAHEHLTLVTEQVHAQFPHLYDDEAIYEAAVEQVGNAMEQGVKTIVEPSCMDIGRDVHLAQRVAEATGVQLVMCTGVYGQHYTFLPQYFENREPQALVDAFLHDIEVGIQGTDVKAAFLKCAVDEPGVTADVERVLRAVAQASKQTGRPIMAHSQPATRRGL